MLGISLSSNALAYGADITTESKRSMPDFVASNTRETLYSNNRKSRQKPSRLNSDSGYVSDIATSSESEVIKSIGNQTSRSILLERIRSIKTNLTNIADKGLSASSSGETYSVTSHSMAVPMKREYHKKFSIPVKEKLDKIASLYSHSPTEICDNRIVPSDTQHSGKSILNKKSYSIYEIDSKGSLWKYQVANRIKNNKATASFCEDNKPTRTSKWQDPAKSHRNLTEKFSEKEMSTSYITYLLTKNIR
ncbi:hypothetical protein SC171_21995 [Pantoea cypripedii]|uniref:hypothetical protein n=1 Tax=Pantoea cypripedii TaxID=55209 RepID=UPI002FC71FB7